MDHSFNIEIAKDVGINSAVLLNQIYWWVKKNEVDERNFYDGKYWTYNSKKGFCKYFPYFSERQIEYALKKLIDEGYVITGNYNTSPYDRKLWYSITEKSYRILENPIQQNCGIEKQKTWNQNTNFCEPIAVNKTISKPVKKSKTIVLESGAPVKSYGDIFKAPEYSQIAEALRKFITQCKGMNYTPQIATVKKWADLLVAEGKNSPEYAMRIVNQSIDKGWKALYPLKGYSGEAVSIPSSEDRLAKDAQGNNIVF